MKCFTSSEPGIALRLRKLNFDWSGTGPLELRFDSKLRLPPELVRYHTTSNDVVLDEVIIANEQPGEVLLFVPAMYGYRGHSSAEVISGAVEVAARTDMDSPRGSLGYGKAALYRVRPGGAVRVRRSGRRVDDAGSELVLSNVGGTIVARWPVEERLAAEALARLNTVPPSVSEEEAKLVAEVAAEARRIEEAKAAIAALEAERVANLRAELARLRDTNWRLEAAVQQARELKAEREREARLRAELGNGLAAKLEALGL